MPSSILKIPLMFLDIPLIGIQPTEVSLDLYSSGNKHMVSIGSVHVEETPKL